MTALADFIAEVNGWLARDYEDAVVQPWVRKAEDRLSEDLRVAEMVQIDTATVTANRVELPDDWLELDFVRVVDGDTLEYVTREELYRLSTVEAQNKYSLSGNYLLLGGDYADGVEVELTYYGRVPRLEDQEGVTSTWLEERYHQLLLFATLVLSTAYGIEDERVTMWNQYVESRVASLNDRHTIAKTSGSMLRGRRSRSFG